MKINVKESDRLYFDTDLVSEMKRQNANVEFTSKRYNNFVIGGITIPDVRRLIFGTTECLVISFTKYNNRNSEIVIPNDLITDIKCLGVFWSEYDEE